jgi:hypothetical protein
MQGAPPPRRPRRATTKNFRRPTLHCLTVLGAAGGAIVRDEARRPGRHGLDGSCRRQEEPERCHRQRDARCGSGALPPPLALLGMQHKRHGA